MILDCIKWVPVDQLASVLVELSLNLSAASPSAKSRVFHPINLKSTSWKSLIPTVIEALQESATDGTESSNLKVVQFDEWTKLLRSTATAVTEKTNAAVNVLRENPAVKLLEFYGSLAVDGDVQLPKQLAIQNTEEESPSLQALEAIKPEWLNGWIRDWVLA
jgi:hypothetical protein